MLLNQEDQSAVLRTALRSGKAEFITEAMNKVVLARGLTTPEGKLLSPSFHTLLRIVDELGLKLDVVRK